MLQWIVFSLLHHAQIELKVATLVTFVTLKDVITITELSFFLSGSLLVTLYGVGSLPYFYRSSRWDYLSTWPIPRWYHPLAHALVILLLSAGLLFIAGLCALGSFGWQALWHAPVPWVGFALSLGIQILSFEASAFFLALLTLAVGASMTLVLSSGFFTLMSMHYWMKQFPTLGLIVPWRTSHAWEWIWKCAPPFGALPYDLIQALYDLKHAGWLLMLWLFWALTSAIFFLIYLSRRELFSFLIIRTRKP